MCSIIKLQKQYIGGRIMKFRKAAVFGITAMFIFGITAFAITDTDVAEFAKKQAEENANVVTEVKTKDGEDLTVLITRDKIIPVYYFKDNGFEQFKDYKTGEFYKEFQTEPVGYCAAAEDGHYIDIERYGEIEKSIGTIDDIPPALYKNIMTDNSYLARLLSDEGVNKITDMRFGFFMDYGSNLIFYINTDKGEFILFGRNTTRAYFDDVLETDKLHTADEVVEWRKRILTEAKAEYEEEQAHISNEPYWTVDENGDDIFVTPEPITSPSPDTTPKPTAAPKATAFPNETAKPVESAEPQTTDKPTAAPKTLSVYGGDAISVTVEQTPVNFPDAKPFIDENNRTQIPIRAVADMLSCTVGWDEGTKTVTITNQNSDTVKLIIGSDLMTVNGKAEQMDTAAMIKDDRTYIPVRFVAEAMGLTVEWVK